MPFFFWGGASEELGMVRRCVWRFVVLRVVLKEN